MQHTKQKRREHHRTPRREIRAKRPQEQSAKHELFADGGPDGNHGGHEDEPANGGIGKDGNHLLEAHGIILGCFEDAVYTEESLSLAPGDTLIVYSDGITEAIDSSEEEFGLEIPDEEAEKIATVGNAIDYIKNHSG